jgi:hypothetical protein
VKRKRDFVDEIVSIKTRTIGVHRDTALKSRLNSLDAALEAARSIADERGQRELLRYLPIGSVACIEGFFRLVIRDLIEKGVPFSDNAVNLNKNNELRLDFQALNAIHGRRITLGDFVSHLLPINNLADINLHLSTLIGEDFLERIKTIDVLIVQDEHREYKALGTIIGDVIQGVNDIFEMRHIYCHELALRTKADQKRIEHGYFMLRTFLLATTECIWRLESVDTPMSQLEINQKAYDEFSALDNEMKQLVGQVNVQESDDPGPAIADVQAAFEQYRELSARHGAREWTGGSGYPMVYYAHLSDITRQRMEELKRAADGGEDLSQL